MKIDLPGNEAAFEPFDIHVARYVVIITNYIEHAYGPVDQAWLASLERVGRETGRARPDFDFAYFKRAVFAPSARQPGQKKRKRRTGDFDRTRADAFEASKRMMSWYGISKEDIVGDNTATKFSDGKYTRWPYYSAALALVVERARSTPHELHVLPESDGSTGKDLQQDRLVYSVPCPRRERGEGDHFAHREGEADVDELVGPAHLAGRSPQGRIRRWSSPSQRTTGSSSSSSAGAAEPRRF